MSSTPVFDVSSYLASLQGDLITLQNNLQTTIQARDTAQTNATNTNNQLQSLSRQYYGTSLGEQGVSSDQIIQLQGLGNQVNSYTNTVSSSNAQINSLNTQISSLKDQITAAQSQVNTQNFMLQNNIPRAIGITDTIGSSLGTGIRLPSLLNISPLYLLGGLGLLVLILK